MTAISQTTYTIRRAAGGCSHFARVTVAHAKQSEGLATPHSQHTDVLPQWAAAAANGVEYALRELRAKSPVSVLAIEGTLADTREDTVFTAAAIAAFRLLGDNTRSEQFDEDEWKVSRP